MSITMKELALLAGVSQSAVSLVLNGKNKGQISAATSEKIRLTAQRHKYRPNIVARGLRNRRQNTIGIMMPIPYQPFYALTIAAMQHAMQQHGYMGLFFFWRDVEEIPEIYYTLCSHNVAGIISYDVHDCFRSEDIPAVFYDRNIPGYDVIRYDYAGAYRKLFDILVERHCTKVGYFAYYADRRYECIRALIREYGMVENSDWLMDLHGFAQASSALEGVERLAAMSAKPEMLIVQNDQIATAVMTECLRKGIKIPGDISIIGYGNESDAQLFNPELSTFDNRRNILAGELVDRIIARIENPELPEQIVEVEPELIVRESIKHTFI